MRRLIVIAIAVIGLVALPVGLPLHLSYVYSGSMEPTLSSDDAYLVVPVLTVDEGDIIVFRSEERGEFVTHRVVEVTPEGYITQGDANEFTDQYSGLPPVTDANIVGRVFTVAGTPVVVPRGGEYLQVAIENRQWTVLLLVLSVLVGGVVKSRAHLQREAVTIRGTFLLMVLLVTSIVVFGAHSYDAKYVVTDGAAGDGRLTVGEGAERAIELNGNTPWYIHRGVTVAGAEIRHIDDRGADLTVDIWLAPRDTTDVLLVRTTVYHYPAILPTPVLSTLHAVHPAVAGLAASAALLLPVYLLYYLVSDPHTPIRAPARRGLLRRLP